MKLVQKILSHGLLIAFLVAGFFVYMNRAEILPQWFGDKSAATEKTDGGSEPLAPSAPASGQNEIRPGESTARAPAKSDVVPQTPAQAPEAAAGASVDQPQNIITEPVVQKVPEPPLQATAGNAPGQVGEKTDIVEAQPQYRPTEETVADVDTPAVQAEAVSVPSIPNEQAAVTTADTDVASETPVQTPAARTEKPTEVAAVQTAPLTPASEAPATDAGVLDDQLEQAREHFWKRDMDAADAAYKALGENYPDNADVWGEIGNFYFSLRKREPAVDAYSRSLVLLTEQGDSARAQQVLGVLYQLDADKAVELEQRLR